jgi:hypothetical protein
MVYKDEGENMYFLKRALWLSSLILSMLCPLSTFAHKIEDIINCFAGHNTMYAIKPFLGPASLIEIDEDGKTYSYYGIHFKDQEKVYFPTLKKMIMERMGLPAESIMQIVGDSGRFSPEGTAFGRRFVRERLQGKFAIEYGYTGYKTGGEELDANSFLNEFIDEQPSHAPRILANILGHTVFAINKWGCYVSPHVHHFVIVYNDAGMTEEPKFDAEGKKIAGFTTFGDDVTMSDYVCDQLLCLEGGAQSFLQVVNVLRQGNPVEVVYNLRKAPDAKMFSAARFLQMVNTAFIGGKNPDKAQVRTIFQEYEKTLKAMFNATKPDFKTKKALFERAIETFIEDGVFEQTHKLCTFYDAAQ